MDLTSFCCFLSPALEFRPLSLPRDLIKTVRLRMEPLQKANSIILAKTIEDFWNIGKKSWTSLM